MRNTAATDRRNVNSPRDRAAQNLPDCLSVPRLTEQATPRRGCLYRRSSGTPEGLPPPNFLPELPHQLLQRVVARAELGVRQVVERTGHGVVLVVHVLRIR